MKVGSYEDRMDTVGLKYGVIGSLFSVASHVVSGARYVLAASDTSPPTPIITVIAISSGLEQRP